MNETEFFHEVQTVCAAQTPIQWIPSTL